MVEQPRHDEFIGYILYNVQKSLTCGLDKMLSQFGITAGQWNILNQLEHHGAMTQKELAGLIHREQAAVVRFAYKLESKGLVARTVKESDRRANIIENTPAGSALLREIEPLAVALSEEVKKGIDDQELSGFIATLMHISENATSILEAEDIGEFLAARMDKDAQ